VSLVGRCCDSGWDGFERLIVSSRLRVRMGFNAVVVFFKLLLVLFLVAVQWKFSLDCFIFVKGIFMFEDRVISLVMIFILGDVMFEVQ